MERGGGAGRVTRLCERVLHQYERLMRLTRGSRTTKSHVPHSGTAPRSRRRRHSSRAQGADSPTHRLDQIIPQPTGESDEESEEVVWVQVAGHPGSLERGAGGVVWKLRPVDCVGDAHPERDAYEAWSACPALRAAQALPQYRGERERAGRRCLELQDLLRGYRNPHVMDVKLGTRTFLEEEARDAPPRADLYHKLFRLAPDAPTPAECAASAVTKLRYMQLRECLSSSAELGFRIEAVHPAPADSARLPLLRDPAAVHAAIDEFLGLRAERRAQLLERLRAVRSALEESAVFVQHEAVGVSVLVVWDERRVGAWLIDLAKVRRLPAGMRVTHRAAWSRGNREDGVLLGLDNLIRAVDSSTTAETRTVP